ncbi:hypothetical protein [Flaviaesturariibacter amylovorans]|uniref:Uncharacterized protein n=1 Tax=Flaviaesturariibacter amylovorans TaxID=1084520 RepID=A0ABP8HKC3_9BACT
MEVWKYYELLVLLEESVDSGLEQGRSLNHSVGILIDDFYNQPASTNRVSNLIVIIKSLLLSFRYLGTVHREGVEFYRKHESMVSETDLSTELEPDEIEHFKEMRQDLERKIGTITSFLDQHKGDV